MTMLKFHAVRRVLAALFLISGLCLFQQLRADEQQFQTDKTREAKLNAYLAAYSKTILTCFEKETSVVIGNLPDSFRSRKKALIDAISTSEWTDAELKKALDDNNVTLTDFEKKRDTYLTKLQSEFIASLNTPPVPPQPIPPDTSGNTTSLLEKVTDFDPLKEDELLFQLLLKFRDSYFSDGKPTTKKGFNKLNEEAQIATIQEALQRHFLGELKRDSSDYKKNIIDDKTKKAFQTQWIAAHQASIKKYAEQVLNNKISPFGDEDQSIILAQDGFKDELRDFINDENKKWNESSDQTIKAETVEKRKTRLSEAAIGFIQKNLFSAIKHPVKSVDDLDPTSKVILEQYLAQYAKPLEDSSGNIVQPTKTGDNPRIAQHKAKVFEFLRNWMRVTSIFSMFTGGFGLEEFFFNKIVEALENIVGASLNSAEKAEVRAWAAELAREAPNPGPVVNQPTIGYPTLVPVLPVNPVYLRPAGSGHHFRRHFP